MVHLIVAYALFLPGDDLKWHQILGHSRVELEKRLERPIKEEVTEYTVYDPRWIKWIEDRDERNRLIGQRVEIVWRYPDDAGHDLDLWENRVPEHAQSRGSWVGFLGAPISKIEATLGAPQNKMVEGSAQTREYRVKGLGNVSVEAYSYRTPTPIVTHVTVTLPLNAQFEPTLKALKIDVRSWKKMDRYVDPNSTVHLRYPLGKGALKEITHPYGTGEQLTIRYAGLLHRETAQAFLLKSEHLKNLSEGVARFGFPVIPTQINHLDGAETYWGHARYAAVMDFRPAKQLMIYARNFDPSDLN